MSQLLSGLSEIGPILRARREQLGKSIETVARALGVPATTLQRIEVGKSSPTWRLVLAYSQALDLQPTLIPRERIRAVEAVTRMAETADAPPLAGEQW